MRKLAALIIITTLVFFNTAASFAEGLAKSEITSGSAILIDANTGQVLFGKNENTIMYPASTTKVLTALIMLENHAIDEVVTIDDKSPFTRGSRIYITEDEVFTMEQLLNALLVESANDVAVALAIHHSGSVEEFAKVMNARAKELGATNSNFVNPNGLPDKDHVSTSKDLALIAMKAYENETFRSIVKKYKYTIPPTNKQSETRYLASSNKFLNKTSSRDTMNYKGKTIDIKYGLVNGLKTGYTDQAKSCLIASATKDGKTVITVVLKANGRELYVDSRNLIDYGLFALNSKTFYKKSDLVKSFDLEDGKKFKVHLYASKDVGAMVDKEIDIDTLTKEVILNDNIKLPIKKNQELGKLIIKNGDVVLTSVPLITNSEISDMPLLALETEKLKKFISINLKSARFFNFAMKLLIAFILWRVVMRALFRKKKISPSKTNNSYVGTNVTPIRKFDRDRH
jgi:D-alanyl-D-alanine carboxypeptidase (penicillin-binding protein 5/6)